MKVRIYRNLNRPSLFSIVALSGEHKGKVLGYAPVVGISNVDLKVSEKQRHSVLEKQVRTVHAFAEGNLVGLRTSCQKAVARSRRRSSPISPSVLVISLTVRRQSTNSLGSRGLVIRRKPGSPQRAGQGPPDD